MLPRSSSLPGWLCFGLLGCAITTSGCHFSDWMNRSVINPPEGFSPSGNTYYNAPANATGPATNLPSMGSGNPVNLSPITTVPLNQTNQSGINAPRDTYNVAARVPQDNQPIQVVERTPTRTTTLAVNGMNVNDGTQARSWGNGNTVNSSNFGQIQPNSQVGINVATLRGTGNTPGVKSSPSFSQQDGQWKSRSSYEATERR